jgi:hypothetical protein
MACPSTLSSHVSIAWEHSIHDIGAIACLLMQVDLTQVSESTDVDNCGPAGACSVNCTQLVVDAQGRGSLNVMGAECNPDGGPGGTPACQAICEANYIDCINDFDCIPVNSCS